MEPKIPSRAESDGNEATATVEITLGHVAESGELALALAEKARELEECAETDVPNRQPVHELHAAICRGASEEFQRVYSEWREERRA
ncbi:hypothetical protein HUG10_21165 (plasmid) [Halorarum halophilum]|uniref:Uncharacterized protein n=1 Tax=Halorarum halophilum TaxID=2743090 RepID=A0A7D5KAT6_9EURY|nr:hypothetical protein [Halobaculum halophilum]QLG30099.1 hypothetical protein HUG10_21165 [Halobaculum halophilum]